MCKDYFKKRFFDKRGSLKPKEFNKFVKQEQDTNEYKYLENIYEDSSSIKESLYRLVNDIEIRPTCEHCGGYVKFNGKQILKYMFNKTCSKECEYNLVASKTKSTYFEKYDAPSWSSSKHGRKQLSEIEKTEKVRNKTNKTWDSKYGGHPMKNKNVLNKRQKTWDNKYGGHPMKISENVKKVFDTQHEIYGDILPCHQSSARKKAKDTMNKKSKEEKAASIKKGEQTSLEKFGKPYWTQTLVGRKFLSDLFCDKEFQKRRRDIMKSNGTLGNKSKQENEIARILTLIYGDENIERQYNTDEYPYDCDFYIKPLNLRIEYNGYWTHGKHPFDETNIDDIKKANEWLIDGRKSFINAYVTWTITDIDKRACAKDNNLRFIEWWSDVYNEIKRCKTDEDKKAILSNKINVFLNQTKDINHEKFSTVH